MYIFKIQENYFSVLLYFLSSVATHAMFQAVHQNNVQEETTFVLKKIYNNYDVLAAKSDMQWNVLNW
jgi:hypothetical protein